jgi:hypothetical protein
MIKQLVLLKRRPGMSLEEFKAYYETRHSLLGIKFMPLCRRYFRRYVVPEPNPVTGEVLELDFDVITEIWWNTRADFESTMREIGKADLNAIFREDEKHIFASHSNPVFTVEETESVMTNGLSPEERRF